MSALLDQYLEEEREREKFIDYAYEANDRKTRIEICKKYLEKYEPTALYQLIPSPSWDHLNVDKMAKPAIPLMLTASVHYTDQQLSTFLDDLRSIAHKELRLKLINELEKCGFIRYHETRTMAQQTFSITATLRVHPNV